MNNIDTMISELVRREGGYSNDPADAGGETMYGITVAEAHRNGYNGPMKDMPFDVAVKIYKAKYWSGPNFDKVAQLFPILGEKLFDFGVNCGTGFAATQLQRCLTALNNGGADYPDLKPDGSIGQVTLNALSAFLSKRSGDMGRRTLLFMVAAQQSNRYLELAEKNPTNEKFLYGWQSQRALYDAIL